MALERGSLLLPARKSVGYLSPCYSGRLIHSMARRAGRARGVAVALLLGTLCHGCATSRPAAFSSLEEEQTYLCARGQRERRTGRTLGWISVAAVVSGFAAMVAADYPSSDTARQNLPLAIVGGVAMGAGAALGLYALLYLWGSGTLIDANCPP